jgi:hypothetical protein
VLGNEIYNEEIRKQITDKERKEESNSKGQGRRGRK